MTDEEKAEEYADKILSDSKYPFIFSKEKVKAYIIKVYSNSLKCCENAFNKGLTEGRKENAELKEQIEKMKRCENCRHNGSDREIGENGDYTDYTCIQCNDFSTKENPYPNWELVE